MDLPARTLRAARPDGQAAAAERGGAPGTPPSRWGTALPDRSRALRVTSSVLLLGALAGFALSMVQLFFNFGSSGTGTVNSPLTLNFGSGTGIANYPFATCPVGGWTAPRRCASDAGHDLLPEPRAPTARDRRSCGHPARAARQHPRAVGPADHHRSRVPGGRGPATISTFGLSAAFDPLGPVDYSAITQSGPDIGFWVVAGLLLAVAMINSPPGRWAARDGRRILGPLGWRGP